MCHKWPRVCSVYRNCSQITSFSHSSLNMTSRFLVGFMLFSFLTVLCVVCCEPLFSLLTVLCVVNHCWIFWLCCVLCVVNHCWVFLSFGHCIVRYSLIYYNLHEVNMKRMKLQRKESFDQQAVKQQQSNMVWVVAQIVRLEQFEPCS